MDHFAISAISSPQTAGTPITGITITAQDAANNTAASFTGTVTFGGTAGCSGTSANFVNGVLSGVSVTAPVAGTDLTLTVDEQGKAQNIQLVKSTNPVIGERVVDAVQKFRWRPATLDKQPVPLDLTLNVEVQR